MAETHGFDGMSGFLAGNRIDLPNGLTWKIKGRFSKNKLFNNLKLKTFKLYIQVNNYTLVDYVGNITEFQHNTNGTYREFFWNHGDCFVISTIREVDELTIETNVPFVVYMIDQKINMLDTKTQFGEIIGGLDIKGSAK